RVPPPGSFASRGSFGPDSSFGFLTPLLLTEPVHGELMVNVLGPGRAELWVFPITWPPDETPPILRTLQGIGTSDLLVDVIHDELVATRLIVSIDPVTGQRTEQYAIDTFPRTAMGRAAPARTLLLPSGGSAPALALDLIHDELLVGFDRSISAYARVATG